MNVRDRDGATQTPQKQSNDATDRDLLAAVRREIVDDTTLSTSAHNVKIIAEAGVVTLRGPVSNAEEKVRVGNHAKQVAGVASVVNELDLDIK
jgi:osmotically-inducible protein OsmY